jgi:hypothetical protein
MNKTITVELGNEQAWALAQFVKRVAWVDIRGCATDSDEAYTMVDAIEKLRVSLSEAGYSPR